MTVMGDLYVEIGWLIVAVATVAPWVRRNGLGWWHGTVSEEERWVGRSRWRTEHLSARHPASVYLPVAVALLTPSVASAELSHRSPHILHSPDHRTKHTPIKTMDRIQLFIYSFGKSISFFKTCLNKCSLTIQMRSVTVKSPSPKSGQSRIYRDLWSGDNLQGAQLNW